MTLKDDLIEDVATALLMSMGTTDTDYKHWEPTTGARDYWLPEARDIVDSLLEGDWNIFQRFTDELVV